MNRLLLLLQAVAVAALVTCAGCRSARSTTNVNSEGVSAGQQLIDLKKALDTGAISQKEYDKMRNAIVKKND